MIPAEYDVGEAKWAFAIATGNRNGEHLVMISSWEGEDMNNLSCVTIPDGAAWSLAKALERAIAGAQPDYPPGTAAWDVCPEVRSSPPIGGDLAAAVAAEMENRYVIAWVDPEDENGGVHTMVFHEVPEGSPDYDHPDNTPIRTYAKDELRPGDEVITDLRVARGTIGHTNPAHPIAVPALIASELGWFPKDSVYDR
jgi:hypothetical protein